MKRVLFVDDELAVLEGLGRLLRGYSDRWEMVFSTSGEEALALLQTRTFDVIVSDLLMPRMDGTQLLEKVRAIYPGVIRIALSGHVEREAALRAAGLVHQYLAKPCDREELVESIERFCASAAILADEAVRRVVGAIGDLPSLPQTASALTRALRQPGVTLGEVGQIIAQDVGMTAKVLQLVNAPLFGLFCDITSLQSALAIIGLDTLRELVLSAEIFRTFEPARIVTGFTLEDFESHSKLTAEIAARLPVAKSILPGSVTAALLHDIGKLVLAVRLPREFERSLHLSQEQGRPLHAVETEVIGASHAEIGAYLLSLWGLAPSIVDAVLRHHTPSKAGPAGEGLDIAGIVHVADALACEQAAKGSGQACPGRATLNLSYLLACGVADEVSGWKLISEQVMNSRFLPATDTVPAKDRAGKAAERTETRGWARSNFDPALTRDFRACMKDMLGMICALMETDLTSQQRECVQALRKSGDALMSMIDDQ